MPAMSAAGVPDFNALQNAIDSSDVGVEIELDTKPARGPPRPGPIRAVATGQRRPRHRPASTRRTRILVVTRREL